MKRPIIEKTCPECEGLGVVSSVASSWGGEPHTYDTADCAACFGVGRLMAAADCAYCLDTRAIPMEASPYVDASGAIVVPELSLPCPHCMPARKRSPSVRRYAV